MHAEGLIIIQQDLSVQTVVVGIPVAGSEIRLLTWTGLGSIFAGIIIRRHATRVTVVTHHIGTKHATELQAIDNLELTGNTGGDGIGTVLIETARLELTEWVELTPHIIEQVTTIGRLHLIDIAAGHTTGINLQAATSGILAIGAGIGQCGSKLQAAQLGNQVGTEVVALQTKLLGAHIVATLIKIAGRNHISGLIATTADADIVVLLHGCLEDLVQRPALLTLMGVIVENLILTVNGGITHIGLGHVTQHGILVTGNRGEQDVGIFPTYHTIQSDTGALVILTFLGSNEHNAIGRT